MVNTIRVIILGTVLARSSSGGFSNPDVTHVRGRIINASTIADAHEKIVSPGGEILACRILTKDYIPIIRAVKGIICEEVSGITDADL